MFNIDITELTDLQISLKKLPHQVFETEVAKKALMSATKVTELSMKNLTPVGKKIYMPKNKGGDLGYMRGGQLRKALRRTVTRFKQFGETTVIVGYSKKSGMAGWRAHFVEYGFTAPNGRFIKGQGFMRKAEAFTQKIVEERFALEIQKEVDKLIT